MTASSEASQASARLAAVRARIAQAAQRAGRDASSVALLAVGKLQSVSALRELHAAGQRAFGENYVQEAIGKIAALDDLTDIQWHFIGPLQANKTREVARHLHWLHSLDRLKIAERLSAQRPPEMPPLEVCIQVNISGEASKSGCAPEAALALARAVHALPRLRLRGFMGMPEPGIGAEATRSQYAALAALMQAAQRELPGLDTLSMGMSDDLEIAIACGSTMVRVGTALFGPRPAAG
ncbi:MAG: YggS family pyridoxal phosphate-dependent enzyme [Burkholderiales bacterium]|nr:YggS family pyridoxal phosphate-dependent enzyme [Burkholderiales bacterium]